jgi:hypothetical protein
MATCKQLIVGTFSSCADAAKAVGSLVKANIDMFNVECKPVNSLDAPFRLKIVKEKSLDDLTAKGMFVAILSGNDKDIDRIQLS